VADPEELLAEGARRAAVAVRELWWRARPPDARDEVTLARVKRRLTLLVTALHGAAPELLPADPPPAPTWLARALGRAPRPLTARTAVASTDGTRVWLPRTLASHGDERATIATYRVLALEQAARAARGTPAFLPGDALERDLYLLAEAVAVDRRLARDFPGLAPDLRTARGRALRTRPALGRLRPAERLVEAMIRDVLAADPAAPPDTPPVTATPAESLAWARAVAAERGALARGYRGVAVVAPWGQVVAGAAERAGPGGPDGPREHATPRARSAPLRHRPRVRRAADDEDDPTPGTWMVRADEPMESVEDPMGLQRPADRDDDAAAADLADALSELPEARVVRTPGSPREVLESDAGAPPRAAIPRDGDVGGAGIVYPEWDHRQAAYRPRGAVVRVRCLPPGSGAWVEDVMRRHAALVARVRRRFDALRPRRVRVGRQADGMDVDLAAYVTAFADWRARHAGDDRLYAAARPARRDLALALLVDASASTDSWVSGALRVIDVEKEALVVLLEALDALGDRHAALAFSGEGPGDVRVAIIKDFDERGGLEVRRRVAALEPDGYTRAGAALRHASALLAGQAARHRLLLILSDGKPNDVDGYEGRYGIEDTRQAVAEARLQGLVPFCLTVDREAPAYLPSIFGRSGYAVLPRQELLPAVLVDVVRRLLAA
jgi:nitric oxide reductase NorD protein